MFSGQEQFMNISQRVKVHSVSQMVISATTSIDTACCNKIQAGTNSLNSYTNHKNILGSCLKQTIDQLTDLFFLHTAVEVS